MKVRIGYKVAVTYAIAFSVMEWSREILYVQFHLQRELALMRDHYSLFSISQTLGNSGSKKCCRNGGGGFRVSYE